MRTILVPAGGSETDIAVFATALAAARPNGSHLDFVHVRVGPGEAAPYRPHVDFARGPGLSDALAQFEVEAAKRAAAAAQHVRDLCMRERIVLQETAPTQEPGVTARWREEAGNAEQRLVRLARHHDLIVMARSRRPNGLPRDLVESVLLSSGRPILLAPSQPPQSLIGTIMVCWRETPEAARALSVALPLIVHAQRLVFVSVDEQGGGLADTLDDLAAPFARNGRSVEAHVIPRTGARATPAALAAAAANCGADLVVMGAYGHARLREVLFGGCTQSFIEHADRAVLMMH